MVTQPEPDNSRREPTARPGPRADGLDEASRRHVNRSPWNWLLVVPLVAVLLPWFYNRVDPTLLGIPFFYWYQLAAIGIGVTCTYVVYRATRGER